MAKLKIFNNIFENSYKEYEYDPTKSLQEQIESYVDVERYTKDLVECYDPEEDKTFYAPIEDDVGTPSVALSVNGKSIDFSYEPAGNEIVEVFFLPTGKSAKAAGIGAIIGAVLGIAAVAALAIATGGFAATMLLAIPALAGVGALAGYGMSEAGLFDSTSKSISSTSGKEKTTSPDIKGSENQSLIGNSFPFVMGKHIVTPFIVGDPYVTYSGARGKEAVIRACYCVGYAPLKLTDFKLGDFYLAHNQDFGTSHPTYLNGVLKGYSTNETDDGDIVDYWKNNDVSLEIMQWDGTSTLNYGHIYPNKITDTDIDANILYVADNELQEAVSYKGTSLPNKFRTNSVYFTKSCPKKFTIVLEAPDDLYATWTKTTESDNESTSEVEYGSIPLWYAVQWRLYSKNNKSSDSNGEDYGAWNNITTFKSITGTGTTDFGATYDTEAFKNDIKAHKGNDFDTIDHSEEDSLWEQIRKGDISIDDYANRVANDTTTVLNKAYPAALSVINSYQDETNTIKARQSSPLDTSYSNFTARGGFRLFSDKPNSFIGQSTSDFKVYIGYLCSDPQITGWTASSGRVFVRETGTTTSKKNVLYLNIQGSSSVFSGSESFINLETGVDFTYVDVNTNITLFNYGEATETNCFTNSAFVDRKISGSSSVHIDRIAVFGKLVINSFRSVPKVANNWFNRTLCNFQSITGSAESEKNLSNLRLIAEVDTTAYAAQMLDSDNSINGIEVRVIRVSPNYLNQAVSNSLSSATTKYSAYTYADVLKFKSIQTESFDKQVYQESGTVTGIKIATEEDIKKFCYVAIQAKVDSSGYITNQLQKLNCVAESFAPIFDSTQKAWLPADVERQTSYYGYYKMVDSVKTACNRSESTICESITQAQYEAGIIAGYDWVREKAGTNFLTKIRSEIFNTASTHNNYPCNTLKSGGEKYNDNNSASIFMLACVGAQNKRAALGYEQINLIKMADWYEEVKDLTDGSTYKVNTVSEGTQYRAGDLVHLKCCCNGYIYKGQKLETLLSKIAITGRASYTYDDCGKISVIFDKKVDYPVGVIASENCLSGSANTYVYEDLPAGLLFNFNDENDGYDSNSIYCFADGFDRENYKGNIESYSIDYVTNPTQLWSLGRYILACRIQSQEILTRKVGVEGHTFALGDVVLVQDEELLIGGGSGRIQEVIEDDTYIYGYVADAFFENVKDVSDGVAQSATTILQPMKYGEARCVTLEIKLGQRTITQNTISRTFKAKSKGNVILFNSPIYKATNTRYIFKTGDICMVGDVNKVSGKYRITKIKPDKNGTFTETLAPYSDTLYNYGKVMPSFDNYITEPPVTIDPITLTDSLNIGTLEKKFADNVNTSSSTLKALLDAKTSNHTVTLYRRSTTNLTRSDLPQSNALYNFSTATLTWTGANNGWYTSYSDAESAVASGTMFVTTATAFSADITDYIETQEWADPVAFAQNGTNGYNTYTIQLFQRASSAPAVPTASSITYNFSTGDITGNLGNWTTSIPEVDSDNLPCWETHATALSNTLTDTIANWSSPNKVYANSNITMADVEEAINNSAPPPTVEMSVSSIGISTDEDSYSLCAQTFDVEISVTQVGEELDFSFGTITCPTGITYSTDGNTITFVVQANALVDTGNIIIEVEYRYYVSNVIYGNKNNTESDIKWYIGSGEILGDIDDLSNLPSATTGQIINWVGQNTQSALSYNGSFDMNCAYYYDDGNLWHKLDTDTTCYGFAQLSNDLIVYEKNLAYTSVKGGRYLGGISSTSSIPTLKLMGDYFCWNGTDNTSYQGLSLKQSALYRWTGLVWELSNTNMHVGNAIQDILTNAKAKISANNSTAVSWVQTLVSNDIFTENITVTGQAVVNALAVTSVVLGNSSEHSNYIQSYNYNSDGSAGFSINADGSAVFNNITIRGGGTFTGALSAATGSFTGAITATSLTLSGCTINQNDVYGLTSSLSNKPDKTTTLTTAKNPILQTSGFSTTGTTGFCLYSDGSAYFNGGGTFKGDVVANSLTLNGCKISQSDVRDLSDSLNSKPDKTTTLTTTKNVVLQTSGFTEGGTTGFCLYSDGSAYFNGGGTFKGDISGATGTFSGALSGATGTFSGSLSSAGGTFNGKVSATRGISTQNITISNIRPTIDMETAITNVVLHYTDGIYFANGVIKQTSDSWETTTKTLIVNSFVKGRLGSNVYYAFNFTWGTTMGSLFTDNRYYSTSNPYLWYYSSDFVKSTTSLPSSPTVIDPTQSFFSVFVNL